MKKQHHPAAKKNNDAPVINKKLLIRLSLIIGIFSLIIYANTIHHGFVLDDTTVIKDNIMTKGGISSLKEIFTTPYRAGYPNEESNLYRPLSKAMFAVEWQLSPDNPAIHHFINILLYSIACILFFLIFSRWTKINIYVLFFTAMLFAAHPIHTEVAANIKSRDEILTMIFLMLSLNALLKYLKTEKIFSFIAYLFCFFLALLSKESAIVFIAIVPLFIYFFTDTPLKKNLTAAAAAIAIACVSLMIHKSVVGSIGLDNIPVIDNSLMAATNVILQKATAVKIMGHYLLLLIFPHPLSSDYSFNTIPLVTGLADAAFLTALAVHIFLFIYALKKFREKHLLSFCILFFFISMSIASNIFMVIGTHLAERLLFLPSIAFCLALSYVICQLFKIKILETAALFKTFYQTGKPYILIMAAILVLYTLKTTSRNKDWKSNGTLFEKDIETVPNSAHMLMYYTDYLINNDSLNALSPESRQARLLKAKNYIQKALTIYELFPDAHYLSGRTSYALKDYENAYKEFNRAMSLNPGIAKYHNEIGTSLFALGKYQEAAAEFEKAVQLNTNDPDSPFNLGSAYGTMGELSRQNNDPKNAEKMFSLAVINFKRAIELKPDYKSAYQFLGTTYMSLGDTINGRINLDKAARLSAKK